MFCCSDKKENSEKNKMAKWWQNAVAKMEDAWEDVADAVEDAADTVLDAGVDLVKSGDCYQTIKMLKDNGTECYQLARETTELCETTQTRGDEMIKFGSEITETLHGMSTKMDVGLTLVAAILKAAKGADAIVTVCPMCQMNLEAYQKKISRRYHEDLSMTIIYLPQFLGLACGLSEQQVGLDLNLSVTDAFRQKIGCNFGSATNLFRSFNVHAA